MQVTNWFGLHSRACITTIAFLISFLQSGSQLCVAQSGSSTSATRLSQEEIQERLKSLGLTREKALREAFSLGLNLEQLMAAKIAQSETKKPESMPAEEQLTVPTANVQQPSLDPLPLSPEGLVSFGYEIFRSGPNAFEPPASGPVDPEYVVGTGDVLRVAVWGQVEFENEYTVDHAGKIFISTIGQVLVSGMTLEQVYDKMLKQMSRSYAGLLSQPPTVWLDVSLARLKPKRVFIMGEVSRPGSYTVSSYATAFNALFAVGGPTVQGSLRDVRVIRDGKIFARVDLYKYLLGAEQTDDVRIQNNDILFVPVRGKTVSIRGTVRKPAIYELKEDEHLSVLLQYCGGVLPDAYATAAQIERIRPLSQRTGGIEDRFVLDVDLMEVLTGRSNISLYDSDRIQLFGVLDLMRNYATIRGSVWRPGRYELGKIQTLKDLILAAEGIQPKTYTGLAHIIRYNEDLVTTRIIPINLKNVLERPDQDQRLQPKDEVVIYSEDLLEINNRYVMIRGEVKAPGRYEFRDGLTLPDLIALAGGYTEEAYVFEAEVSRVMPKGFSGDSLTILFHPVLPEKLHAERQSEPKSTNDGEELNSPFYLQHRDEVLVRANPGLKQQQNIIITGEVTYPGVYALRHKTERLSDILTRGGGPTSTAYLGGARLYRNGNRVLLDFEEALFRRKDIHDIVMQGGDSIAVPSRPSTILVMGEVQKPGLLSYIEGDDLTDYVERAGGLTDSAHFALVTKPTGESQRVGFGIFSSDPEIPDGSVIEVKKEPPSRPAEIRESTFITVKDIFALLTSAATLIFIIHEASQ